MADEDKRPIIIRRKVVKSSGHHGGAWKVAYADFVTAMMAFFLLMWLLNATTEEQRKGLADYFSPSIPVHRTSGGGSGPFGGNSVTAEEVMAQTGTGASQQRPTTERESRGDTGLDDRSARDDTAFQGLADALVNAAGESAIADRLLQHVRLRRTEEGLVIDIMELPNTPLFFGPTAEPTARMRELVDFLAPVLNLATNRIAVDNHLDTPALGRPGGVGWQLTSARALSVRELLAEAAVAPSRFARVTGEADRTPLFEDPREIRNSRTELILLNPHGS